MQDSIEKNAAPVAAPTLMDVARRAGVNKITASVAMNGKGQGNTHVSEATRLRVMRAAEELHYQPNSLAQSLRHRKTNTMGFYFPGYMDTRDLFVSEIVSGLHDACEQNHRDFLLYGTFRGDSIDAIYAELLNGKVDGLVIFVQAGNPLVARLAASHLPVIALANAEKEMACVTVDDLTGARMQAEHLAKKGHRIVFYATSPYHLGAPDRRYQAFLACAKEWNIQVITGTISEQGSLHESLEKLMSTPAAQRPTAIVCWHDQLAFYVVENLRSRGIKVPDDMAVIGFDGASSSIPAAFKLTTVRAPWHNVGRTAMDLLCKTNGKPPAEETILPVEWIAGETA